MATRTQRIRRTVQPTVRSHSRVTNRRSDMTRPKNRNKHKHFMLSLKGY